jgi:hypothetical protein
LAILIEHEQGNPTVAFDRSGGTNSVVLDFFSDFGAAFYLNVGKATITKTITSQDPFFIGFTNFYVNGTLLEGLSPSSML